jgi:hypothetical protein
MMAYQVASGLLQDEPRVTWTENIVENERRWYAVDRIGEKGYLLFHGNQVKSLRGLPFRGLIDKVAGWRLGGIPESFDYALAGHWHNPATIQAHNITLFVSGSPESDNTFASEVLAAQGRPSQLLLFAHPKRGVTSEYRIYLDHDDD